MDANTLKEQIKFVFSRVFPLSATAFSELEPIFTSRTVCKDEVFIRTGQKNASEYVVLDGFCRAYLLSPEGEEITLSFFKKYTVLSPHIIRTKNNISLLNFQALTSLELLEFDAGTFLEVMIKNLEIRNFGNDILKNELFRKTEREMAFASNTAMQRLVKFREEYAVLENLIAHPIIASYLGITNVSLSRLRAEVKRH